LLSLQIFSLWFALLYIYKVNERADDMFEVSRLLRALRHGRYWSRKEDQDARLLFD
jgi:hypothetical protein